MNDYLFKKYKELEKKYNDLSNELLSVKNNMDKLKTQIDNIENNTYKTDIDSLKSKPKIRNGFMVTDWCILQDCNQPECHNCFPVKGCSEHDLCKTDGCCAPIPIRSDTN